MIGQMQERDNRVVIHVGQSRQLTQKQIGLLEFPYCGNKGYEYSYNTCQRRIREFYIPNKFLSEPTYMDLKGNGSTYPIYTLASEGKALYEHLTGFKPKTNYISFKYTPHLIETNKIIIFLKRKGYINIDDKNTSFEIEYKVGDKLADLRIEIKEFAFYVEIDLSEKDWKKEIQEQFNKYQKAFKQGKNKDKDIGVLYYSNRSKKLKKWLSQLYKGYLKVKFCKRQPKNISQAIRKFAKEL
ncbi:MAG: hypothetical protein ACOC1K_03215 [Nanoarchaeota archaeon]